MKDLRFHQLTLDATSKVSYTDEGFLVAPVTLTRTGVFDYPERTRKELRPPEEVFAPASMDSIVGKSVTVHHPWDMVTPENVKEIEVGTVIGPIERTADDMMTGRILIKDRGCIDYIETARSRKEDVKVSCGYFNEDDPRPGEWNGQKYDSVQRNIRYNHLAIGVERPRAGDNAKLSLDNKHNPGGPMKKHMKAIKIDGIIDLPEVKIETEKMDEIDAAMQSRIDSLESAIEKMGVTITEKQAKVDELTGKVDSFDAKEKELKKQIDSMSDPNGEHIKNMVAAKATIDSAAETLGIELKGATMDEMKVEIINATFDGVNLDGKSGEYINARFDAALDILNDRRNAQNASALRDQPHKDEKEAPTRQELFDKLGK